MFVCSYVAWYISSLERANGHQSRCPGINKDKVTRNVYFRVNKHIIRRYAEGNDFSYNFLHGMLIRKPNDGSKERGKTEKKKIILNPS